MDNYNYIHHASNDRLSEMLEQYHQWMDSLPENNEKPPFTMIEVLTIIKEVTRRLRIPPHQTFNDEAFDM